MLVSARSLQIGPAVPVIAVTSVAANAPRSPPARSCSREPLPDDTLGLVVRILAFAPGDRRAALTPPPLEAEAKLP